MDASAAPGTMEVFEARLQEVAEDLPKRLKQCAEFVAENPERIAVSTVAELATAAGVQPSAFVRFCQILGFSGFSEMQRLFRDAYAPRWPDYRTRIDTLRSSGQDRPAALLAEFVEAGRHSLESLAKTVDYAASTRPSTSSPRRGRCMSWASAAPFRWRATWPTPSRR